MSARSLVDYITGVLTDRTIDHSHRCGANKQGSYLLPVVMQALATPEIWRTKSNR
jgi:hypothetical protein